MKKLFKISLEFAVKIAGKTCFKDNFFYPIMDINGDYFISQEEVNQCTNWRYIDELATLELADFVPPIPPVLIIK